MEAYDQYRWLLNAQHPLVPDMGNLMMLELPSYPLPVQGVIPWIQQHVTTLSMELPQIMHAPVVPLDQFPQPENMVGNQEDDIVALTGGIHEPDMEVAYLGQVPPPADG